MSAIMCSQQLWKVVRSWAPPTAADRDGPAATIGPWAATLCRDGSRSLAIAIDSQTYLTIVFAFSNVDDFYRGGADALRAVLEALGVPADQTARETEAVASAPLVRLADPDLREALKTVKYMCEIELEYHRDLRRVQANLNEYPHKHPPYYVPSLAARTAFGLLPREPLR